MSQDQTTAPIRLDVSEEDDASRRAFLKKFASGVFAGLVAPAVLRGAISTAQEAVPSTADAYTPETVAGGDSIMKRMTAELHRAMQKPIEQRKWVMVIDLRKCTGCQACNIACIAENQLPPGVVYRPVIDEEIGTYPNVTIRSTPRPCMQCENPPCVPVCPVSATWRAPDGIIEMDYDQCIGCRYCMTACPYHARTFDFGYRYTDDTPAVQPYEEQAAFEYGERRQRGVRNSPVGNVRKCHFCRHKLNAGVLPSCVTTCIGHATYFGDANDSESLVSDLIAQPNATRLKEEAGANPRVYYLL